VSERKPGIFRLWPMAGGRSQSEHLFQIEENLK